MMDQKHTKNDGFTLVEMLVSISLFSIVLTMSIGTLLILIDANGRAQSMQLVMTNLTFALDSMTREVRTGFNWHCKSASGNNPSVPPASSMRDCDSGNGGAGNFISVVESGDNMTRRIPFCAANDANMSSCSHRISYYFDANGHGTGHGSLKRRLGLGSGNEDMPWVSLTGPEIWIDEFRVVVSGTDRQQQVTGDTEQPTATIFIKGRAGVDVSGIAGISEREFDIQTTVSQRLLDI